MNKTPKTLFVDVEVSPLIGYSYQRWDARVIDVDHEQHIQSFAYKWLGQDKTYCYAQPDFPIWKKNRFDDSELAKKLWEIMNQADIVVAHNAKKFDIKQINTASIRGDLGPPRPYKVLDTLQIARKHFKFSSNSLDELGKALKVGSKLEKGVPQLWKLCMNGDKKAWGFMKAYNIQDVVLLEKIYKKFLPWIDPYPITHMNNDKCRKCGDPHVVKRGWRYTKTSKTPRLFCVGCSSWDIGVPEKDS